MQTKNIVSGIENGVFYLKCPIEKDSIPSAKNFIDNQKPDKLYSVEIKEYRKPRSLTANGYYHALKQKLADVLRTSKDELHEIMLERYGQLVTKDGQIVKLSTETDLRGTPRYNYLGESELSGKAFYHYTVTKGSHEYDSREFSILLDGLISECREQGIETLNDSERALLKYEI